MNHLTSHSCVNVSLSAVSVPECYSRKTKGRRQERNGLATVPLHLAYTATEDIVTVKTVTTRIPEADEATLSELEAGLSTGSSEVLRRLIRRV